MLTFEWPLLLWALAALPALLALYVVAQRRCRAYAVRFTNLALLGNVVHRGPGARRHVPPLLYLIGLAALLVSLARPSAVVAVPRDQATLMLVMDVRGPGGGARLCGGAARGSPGWAGELQRGRERASGALP